MYGHQCADDLIAHAWLPPGVCEHRSRHGVSVWTYFTSGKSVKLAGRLALPLPATFAVNPFRTLKAWWQRLFHPGA
jgi:hypothetical protein